MTTDTKVRHVEPDITVVEISGTLNLGNVLASTEFFVRRLINEGARKLVLDLSGLKRIDSAGIGMLVGCYGEMEQAGGQFRVAGAGGSVAQVFGVVRLDRILHLDPDAATSCRVLAGTAGDAESGSQQVS